MLVFRELFMGFVFGMKGGVIGGGVFILEFLLDIDFYFNGDIYVFILVNNFLFVIIDNYMYFGNELNIKDVYW